MIPTEPQTRFSHTLPELRFSLSLLYVGRFLLGMHNAASTDEERVQAFDDHIETVTDELVATELLHEAAVLAGDILPSTSPENPV
ncbi:hypothetical protein [Spirosoma aerolatum]|uniref:hypothetical protein n=1 Tax=Spirosoma aerolatum TaxID=1211326 RepID=UPI0009ACA260|nr:hypothetical protein [Spirosoma aerolatum]